MIRFRCHNTGCRRWIQAPESAAGLPAVCPACRDDQRVPSWFGPDTAIPRGPSRQSIPAEGSPGDAPAVSLSRRALSCVAALKVLALAAGFLLLVGLLLRGGLWLEGELHPRNSSSDPRPSGTISFRIDPCALGDELARQGRVEEAVAAYRAAVRRNPGRREAYIKLGTLLRKAGREDEAREAFRKALEIEPELGSRP